MKAKEYAELLTKITKVIEDLDAEHKWELIQKDIQISNLKKELNNAKEVENGDTLRN